MQVFSFITLFDLRFFSNIGVKLLVNPNKDKIQPSPSLVVVISSVLSFILAQLSEKPPGTFCVKSSKKEKMLLHLSSSLFCNNDISWENMMQIAVNNIAAGNFE